MNDAIPITAMQMQNSIKLPENKPTEEELEFNSRSNEIYDMAVSRGWEHIKQKIKDDIEYILWNLNIGDADTIDLIGLKYMTVRLLKIEMEGLIDYVESIKMAIDEERRKDREVEPE